MTLRTRLTLATGLLLTTLALFSASALAAGEGPGWELTGVSTPTNLTLPAGGVSGTIILSEFNVGAGASHGIVTVTDRLPAGLRAADAGELAEGPAVGGGVAHTIEHSLWACVGNGPGPAPKLSEATVVTCTNDPTNLPEIPGGAGNPTDSKPQGPHLMPKIAISVNVQAGAEEHEINRATIAGGGAPTPASTENPVTISSALPPSGVVGWDGWFSNANGTLDTQAGSHPYAFTTTFALATQPTGAGPGVLLTGGELRNVEVALPPGVVGNPSAAPQCSRPAFDGEKCPALSEIGVVTLFTGGIPAAGLQLWNLVPPPGVPAEFGFILTNVHSLLDASVRSGSDYGINEQATNIAQKEAIEVVTTVWGDPGDPSHNLWRSGATGGCFKADEEKTGEICAGSERPILNPFLTLPTACGKPLPFVLHTTTWTGEKRESVFYSHDSNGPGSSESDPSATGFTGCGNLAFGPTFTTTPDTSSADTPTGLAVDVKPPLGGLEAVEGDGSADIAGTTVTLPPGFVINPGQAAGLQACGPGQDGLTTAAERSRGEEDNGPPACPNASKVGTVTAKSPLLEGAAEKELSGNVYVLQSNPPDVKLLAAFSADGVNVKLVLDAVLNEQTGQITTKVVNVPQFPVSDFKLTFDGGAKAALDTPVRCGTYTTSSDFTSSAAPFISDAFPTAAFAVLEGPAGSACPGTGPLPYAPSLTAGSSSNQAGRFTAFTTVLSRADGQQRTERFTLTLPEGTAGMISQVPLCGETDANDGTCPASSQIGHAIVTAGPGNSPLTLPQPGEPETPIYLTGPYEGAPFGLSIPDRVIAGPFDLGTVTTRATLNIDPATAKVTATTDPLPQIVKGVPTDIRSIYASIDRPGFLFNPTSCTPQTSTGTAYGTAPTGGPAEPQQTAGLSSPFGLTGCRELAFTPKVAVATAGHASRANGASLRFKIAYPKGAFGTQSWFNEVKFTIPKQLPARLTTLQKACLAKVYETERQNCPPASKIGTAVVHTQVLPVPLEGPVYFVSYGGAKFPDAVLDLRGDNVHIELHGNTLIEKGVTSATFRSTPDVPFENIEVTLPTGRYSEFGTNLPHESYDFCGRKLKLPTFFKAQNGLEIHENTPVAITGCPKHHKHSKHRTSHKKTARHTKR